MLGFPLCIKIDNLPLLRGVHEQMSPKHAHDIGLHPLPSVFDPDSALLVVHFPVLHMIDVNQIFALQ